MKKRSVILLFRTLLLFVVCVSFAGCKKIIVTDALRQPNIKQNVVQTLTADTLLTKTTSETQPETTSELKYLNMGKFKLTAYCPCFECSEQWGDMTATGVRAKAKHTIAVDEDVIPYGTEVVINGQTYIAEDCGAKVVGNHIDIFFENHEEAKGFGVQYACVLLKVNKAY